MIDDNDIPPTSDQQPQGVFDRISTDLESGVNAAENAALGRVGDVQMVAVNSSDIAAWGYDPVGFKLQIQFTNGRIHVYSNVSPLDFEQATMAPSKGKWFWAVIRRNPIQYPWTRIQ